MAILTSGSFYIPAAEAQPLLTRSRRDSFVLQNATRIAVTPSGAVVPVFVDNIDGNWVGEAQPKPVEDITATSKDMIIRKWAVIVPVSQESVTDQNAVQLLTEIAENAQAGFGRAVDNLAILGGGFVGQSYINQSTKGVVLGTAATADGGLWTDLNEGLRTLVSDTTEGFSPRVWTGSVFDAIVEPDFNEAVDLNGRPLFTDTMVGESNTVQRYGRLLGRPSSLQTQIAQGSAPNRVVGWAGDWSRVYYGLVGDIQIDYDNRATVVRSGTPISAFQDNLVMVRVEARIGVLVADPQDFVKFYGQGQVPTS